MSDVSDVSDVSAISLMNKAFIEEHLHDDPLALRLKYAGQPEVQEAITQIECRQRTATKLRDTLKCECFRFPTALSAEQSTSDVVAHYHASLIKEGERVIDLTTGLGIDAMHIARHAKEVTCVERDPVVAAAIGDNARALGLQNITVICDDCRNVSLTGFDTAFIDPARRGNEGQRLYDPRDCQPDVAQMLTQLKSMARRVMVKLSPMLDIEAVRRYLGPSLHTLQAVGTSTECKELLAILSFYATPTEVTIEAVTLFPDSQPSIVKASQSVTAPFDGPLQGRLLIEPYPSVMKVGAHKIPASWRPLHPQVPLFIADNPMPDLGRAYIIEEVWPWQSSTIKALKRRHLAAQVAVRSMGITAQQLAQRLGVTPGDNLRIIGTLDHQGQRQLLLLLPYSEDND